jgi:hypothetical protein
VEKTATALPPRPPWRPFTRESSLSKIDATGFLDRQKPDEMETIKKGDNEEENNPSIYQNR